jgi:hypothetical protein
LRTKETGGPEARPVSLVRLLGKGKIVQQGFGVQEPKRHLTAAPIQEPRIAGLPNADDGGTEVPRIRICG